MAPSVLWQAACREEETVVSLLSRGLLSKHAPRQACLRIFPANGVEIPSKGEMKEALMSCVDNANYDEAKVPGYELPSPLSTPEGEQVADAFEWANFQRGHVLNLFEKQMYGQVPPRPDTLRFEILNSRLDALGGLAVRKEVRIHSEMRNGRKHFFDMLMYAPANATSPVPAFVGLNFKGNHTTTDEEDVRIPTRLHSQEDPAAPGLQKSCWQFEEIIRRGCAVCTACYCDIYMDRRNSEGDSIYSLFGGPGGYGSADAPGGAISAWAWGLSRICDYLETETAIDKSRIAVHGHSRLGKTALWAGAVDQRFAMLFSINSGCGGAALSRRIFGETIGCFPAHNVGYWYTSKFFEYVGRENQMPFDQHMLIALAAPRPVYIASANEDLWADPKGEFLSAVHAAPVYRLFGNDGLGTASMPPPDTSIGNAIGYHIRTGKHDVTEFDWHCFLSFAERHFKKQPTVKI